MMIVIMMMTTTILKEFAIKHVIKVEEIKAVGNLLPNSFTLSQIVSYLLAFFIYLF